MNLGCFCAHLEISTYRLMSHHSVSDFPSALVRLHSQFNWPYPVPGKHVVDQLEKRLGAMTTSRSSCSLSGEYRKVNSLLVLSGSFNGEVPKPPVLQPKENGVTRPLTPPSEGDESCSVKEAQLLPLGAGNNSYLIILIIVFLDTSPQTNGRISPDSLLTQGTPETPTTKSTAGDWQGKVVDSVILFNVLRSRDVSRGSYK